jgi:hypothetical protein
MNVRWNDTKIIFVLINQELLVTLDMRRHVFYNQDIAIFDENSIISRRTDVDDLDNPSIALTTGI